MRGTCNDRPMTEAIEKGCDPSLSASHVSASPGTGQRDLVPALNPHLTMNPFDTGKKGRRFIVDIQGKRQFEVSELVYRILQLVDGKRTAEEIAGELNASGGSGLSAASARRLIDDVLLPNGFLIGQEAASQAAIGRTFLHPRFSLLSQDMLRPVTDFLGILFDKRLFAVMVFFSTAVPIYTFVVLPVNMAVVGSIGGVQLVAVYGIVLATAFIHELGHSSACAHCRITHGDIGVGLYMFFPVLFADVSGVWKLDRRKRMMVDAGGVYFQMMCLPVLCLAYVLSESTIVLGAIFATCITMATALNPFLRFDGYWLVSDFFGVPNLRKRSLETLRLFMKRRGGAGTLRTALRHVKERDYGIAVLAYGALSGLFFALLFVQLGFLIEAYISGLVSALETFRQSGTELQWGKRLKDALDLMNSVLPVLLLIVPLSAWAISGLRRCVKLAGAHHTKKCEESGFEKP